MTTVVRSTREQIIRTAEALFAEHGSSAVVFEYRLPGSHDRRELLIAERRRNDLRGCVTCQARAVLEQSELDGSHFMALVAMLHRQATSGCGRGV